LEPCSACGNLVLVTQQGEHCPDCASEDGHAVFDALTRLDGREPPGAVLHRELNHQLGKLVIGPERVRRRQLPAAVAHVVAHVAGVLESLYRELHVHPFNVERDTMWESHSGRLIVQITFTVGPLRKVSRFTVELGVLG
jgi:hypothetical protein